MIKVVIIIFGMILINSFFYLVTLINPNGNPLEYIIYQGWFNILLVLYGILPIRKAEFLYKIKDKKRSDEEGEDKKN